MDTATPDSGEKNWSEGKCLVNSVAKKAPCKATSELIVPFFIIIKSDATRKFFAEMEFEKSVLNPNPNPNYAALLF